MKTVKLTQENFGILALCAIRYCQGRRTYMPDLVRNIVRPHLGDISNNDLDVMLEDCKFQDTMHLWGDERIDKPGWLKWRDELEAEKLERNKEKGDLNE